MNNLHVTALLDRPMPRSFGMLGIIVDTGSSLQTEGLLGELAGPLDASQFTDLVSGKHAVAVNGPTVNKHETNALAALWIGDEFAAQSDLHGLTLPKLPERTAGRTDGGSYWISSTQHIWRVWDSWLVQAFRRAVGGEDQFATMMSWASADRDESRAARWLTTTQKQRDRDLAWWSRVTGTAGKGEVSPEQLETRFRLLIDQVRSRKPSSVFGFTARAKGGDNTVADIVARRRGLTPFGFGSWLRTRVQSEGVTPVRTVLQKRGQEMIDKVGALEFCLEVLRDLPSLADQSFVIDGIRHMEVLNALRFLVGPERFSFTFVHRSDDERKRLLISRENLSPSVADDVMSDVTEREISSIEPLASFRLEADVESEAERLLTELPA